MEHLESVFAKWSAKMESETAHCRARNPARATSDEISAAHSSSGAKSVLIRTCLQRDAATAPWRKPALSSCWQQSSVDARRLRQSSSSAVASTRNGRSCTSAIASCLMPRLTDSWFPAASILRLPASAKLREGPLRRKPSRASRIILTTSRNQMTEYTSQCCTRWRPCSRSRCAFSSCSKQDHPMTKRGNFDMPMAAVPD